MKTRSLVVASVLGLISAAGAYGHGDHKPKYGGMVGRGDEEVVVEFVVAKDKVTVYVEDEQGKGIETKDFKGTLTLVPQQGPPKDVALVPAGSNTLTAAGLQPVRGVRLIARLTLPGGQQLQSVALYAQ